MTADAVVVAQGPGGRVDLEFRPRPCAACAGTCLWKRLKATRIERLEAARRLEPGTEVVVTLSERRVLMASLLMHGVPLGAILAGAAAGTILAASDAGTLIGAILGLGIALVGLRPLAQRAEMATLSRLSVLPKE